MAGTIACTQSTNGHTNQLEGYEGPRAHFQRQKEIQLSPSTGDAKKMHAHIKKGKLY